MLHQAYPNPFNPTTTIGFELPEKQFVSIEIFNLLGQQINSLMKETLDVGRYSVNWNGKNKNGIPVQSGVYFVRMRSGNYIKTSKLMLLK